MTGRARVFIVDDDAAVRDALAVQLGAAGHDVVALPGAMDLLGICTPGIQGCVILDVDMPGMDGPALQEELARRGLRLPVIFLSGRGTIPITVRTVKAGAMDFLTKPVKAEVLLARVKEALEQCSRMSEDNAEYKSVRARLATLSRREREVMQLAVAGKTSKEIGQILSISYRTVDIHRTHAMQKTGSSNLLELARFASKCESIRLED
jgi:FixJ family two-component response regulator